MSITVKGGIVSLSTNVTVKAEVNTIEFANSNRVNGAVPINAEGVMTLNKTPDHQNFVKGDNLNYRDSNHNNDASFKVTSVVGPTKYKVTRTA